MSNEIDKLFFLSIKEPVYKVPDLIFHCLVPSNDRMAPESWVLPFYIPFCHASLNDGIRRILIPSSLLLQNFTDLRCFHISIIPKYSHYFYFRRIKLQIISFFVQFKSLLFSALSRRLYPSFFRKIPAHASNSSGFFIYDP